MRVKDLLEFLNKEVKYNPDFLEFGIRIVEESEMDKDGEYKENHWLYHTGIGYSANPNADKDDELGELVLVGDA